MFYLAKWIPIPTCFSLPETTMKVDHDQLEKIIWHCHFRTSGRVAFSISELLNPLKQGL